MPASRSSGTRRNRTSQSEQLYQQLQLPLFEPLVGHGLQQIHHRPWVGDEEKIRRGRKPAQEAWGRLAIRGNPPTPCLCRAFSLTSTSQTAGSTR